MLDFTVLTTEAQNENTTDLDLMSAFEITSIMNAEDQKVAEAVKKVLPEIARAAEWAAQAIQSGCRVIYVGAGTSGRLGVLDAVECEPTFGVTGDQFVAVMAGGEGAFVKSVEGAEDDQKQGREDLKSLNLSPNDFVVGVAASGRTPYVYSALRYATETGCHTAAISCNNGAHISSAAELSIEAVVGPEVIAGSTRLKSGTAQKMVLNMISTASMVLSGKVYMNLMVDVAQTNAKLCSRARNIVMQATGVGEMSARTALDNAQGSAKTAITMLLTGLDADAARKRLDGAGGHVRRALSTDARDWSEV